MFIKWDAKHKDKITNMCNGRFKTLELIIEHYYSIGKKDILLISDFHFVVDQFAVDLSNKLGFPRGCCPYDSVDKKCPLVDMDEEHYTKYKIEGSLEHSHIGSWSRHFFVKNGYDHGLELFVFNNNEDCNIAIALYSLGEKYAILA